MSQSDVGQSSNRLIERVALTTDDAQEAWDELQRRRATGEWGWDMGKARGLGIRTSLRYAVWRYRAAEADR